jgi:metal-dependent amidase/aminoacylase/carboxypeptidase family protein
MTPVQLSVITQLRHTLHQHPELSMQEKETMKILQTFLQKNTSLEIHIRDGWFYALKKSSGSLPSNGHNTELNKTAPIAFRADMDALPIPESIKLPYESQNEGISHKCGHDGHCAILCGLALELDNRETNRDVYLIFQPGEEIGAGAKRCAELIREKGITEIYAMHNLGGYPEGSLVYRRGLTQPASEGLRICLTGKTSHASAPEKGNNPAGAVASIVQYALRAADPSEDRVHGISEPSSQTPEHDLMTRFKSGTLDSPMRLCTITGIRLGDGDFGISPGEGEVCMTLRAEVEEEMLAMEQSIISFARQVAAAAGLQMTYSSHDYFPETCNHDDCLDRVLDAAQENKIPAIFMRELWRASEDFGHYLKICPGAMFYIGNGEDYPPLHTAEYDFNDRIIETAVNMFMRIAGIPV